MGSKTNQQFVMDLMSFGPHGPLSELFVIEALRRYAADVAAAPPMKDNAMFSGQAWRTTGQHIDAAIAKHLGEYQEHGPSQPSTGEE